MLNLAVKDAVRRSDYAIAAMETMCERIKTLREARHMSQTQLADACSVTKSAVSQWENGVTENIKLRTFLALVEVLRTDVEYLVHGAARTASPAARSRSTRTAND